MQYRNQLELPGRRIKSANKDMAAIGTKKTLRNGITVEITKVNPVTTFNAIKRELIKRGYELDSCRKATTGSRYLKMHSDEIEIDVRCSDHTYASNACTLGLDRNSSENKIYSISIDLSTADMNIAGFRSFMNEIDDINTNNLLAGIVDTYKTNGMAAAKVSLQNKEISEIIINAVCDYLKDFVK